MVSSALSLFPLAFWHMLTNLEVLRVCIRRSRGWAREEGLWQTHAYTQIKVALSTGLVRGSQGCDFLKTNVKRETTPRCSSCSTDKSKQTKQCGFSWRVCVWLSHPSASVLPSAQTKVWGEQAIWPGSVSALVLCLLFSLSLMISCFPYIPSYIIAAQINWFRFRIHFLHQVATQYRFLCKSQQNSLKININITMDCA